ncbi:hypothetical protein VTK56DRAFT_4223 [Thermocarpiscus australiensis]
MSFLPLSGPPSGLILEYDDGIDSGHVVRVGPEKVVCTDIEAMYRISGVRSGYIKSDWYGISPVSRDSDPILSMRELKLRKKPEETYYACRVDFEEGTNRALRAWIDLIERKYITSKKANLMDFEQKAHFYSLDAVGEIAYSEPLECVKNDKDTKGVLAINDATVPILMALSNYTNFWRLLRMWPLYLLLPNDGGESGFGAIVRVSLGLLPYLYQFTYLLLASHASKLIAQRIKSDAKPKRDMLQSFIAHGLRGEALKQEVGILFFAGSDSVASMLYTTLYLLLTHPPCYNRLQLELDTAFNTGKISTPLIHDTEARDLPYLQAVIREGLRLFPPLTVAPLFKKCGVPWEPGERLLGGDGDCFRPERWLEAEAEAEAEAGAGKERLGAMTRRVELAFGSGQFLCVGRGIAMVELGKVLAGSLADPLNPPRICNPGVWVIRDFWVRVEDR